MKLISWGKAPSWCKWESTQDDRFLAHQTEPCTENSSISDICAVCPIGRYPGTLHWDVRKITEKTHAINPDCIEEIKFISLHRAPTEWMLHQRYWDWFEQSNVALIIVIPIPNKHNQRAHIYLWSLIFIFSVKFKSVCQKSIKCLENSKAVNCSNRFPLDTNHWTSQKKTTVNILRYI